MRLSYRNALDAIAMLRHLKVDLKEYLKRLRRRVALERKYNKSPEICALIHRRDLEINNFEIITIGKDTSLGRFCSLRDYGTGNVSRSITLGEECWVAPRVEFAVWDNHHICLKGDTTVNEGTKIYGSVTIEKYCLLAANIFISSGNHHADYIPPLLIKDQDALYLSSDLADEHSKPIHIEEDCWIGCGAFLKQGIYIGRGAIIGTNSVVLNDVPPYSVQAGSPNRELKTRLPFQPPDEIRANEQNMRPYFYRGFHQRLADVTESLKRGVIFAEKHSAVTLNKKPCTHLRIKGQLNPGIISIQLRIQLNGQKAGDLMITESEFDCELEINREEQPIMRDCNASPLPLQSVNFYTFDIIEVADEGVLPTFKIAPYGLSVIQQIF